MSRSGIRTAKSTRGFLIPLAIFILVGLAALASVLMNISTQAGNSSIREGISIQAFYAADSGAQYAMHRLYYPNPQRAAALAACTAINGDVLNYSAQGLTGCSASLACSSSNNTANTRSFFTVTSRGRCGSADLLAERVIEAAAAMGD